MNAIQTLSATLIEVANQPITFDNFAGDDCRYSAEFETLEAACLNTQSLHSDAKVDWTAIAAIATTFLQQQSKDLRVAIWLTWALQQDQGYPGLYAGLTLLERLIDTHWDTLHPRKARTRSAVLIWLATRLDGLFEASVLARLAPEELTALATALMQLERLLEPRLSDAASLLLPLVRRLDDQRKRSTQPLDIDKGTATPRPIVAPAAPVPTATLGHVVPESDKDAHRLLRQMQDGARSLNGWWLKQRAGDLRALRLNRALLWSGIDSLPAHDAQGVTGLRGLPADRLTYFQEQRKVGEPAALLAEVEASLARAPFWFDGQRLAWECLQALKLDTGCREIEWPLALLLQRLPGLETLAFHDGQPFADQATQLWLAGLSTRTAKDAPVTTSAAADCPAWEGALSAASATLRSEGLKPALRLLQSGRSSACGGRERLHWSLVGAQLLIQARQHELALCQLTDLDDELTGPLGDWEPHLTLEVLQLRRQCLEALPATPDTRTQLQSLRPRLCRLDLEAALA